MSDTVCTRSYFFSFCISNNSKHFRKRGF